MKRTLTFCFILVLAFSLFTGCTGKGNVSDTDDGRVDGTNASVATAPTVSTAAPESASGIPGSTTASGETDTSASEIPDETTPVKPAQANKF